MNAIARLKKAGLSRADIARHCNVPRQTVHHWEHGDRLPNIANLAHLVRIAEDHGITLLAQDFLDADAMLAVAMPA